MGQVLNAPLIRYRGQSVFRIRLYPFGMHGPNTPYLFPFLSTLMMASNTLDQSTLSGYELGPSCSLEDGASPFTLGEYILFRIPQEIKVDGYVENEATACGTDLPPTSNGRSPQHFAFIRQMYLNLDDSWILEVYPVVSFTRSGGAVQGYRQLTDAGKAALLPLPKLSLRHPTPAPFGTPFGTWSTLRDSFLLVIPMRFETKRQRPVSLSFDHWQFFDCC